MRVAQFGQRETLRIAAPNAHQQFHRIAQVVAAGGHATADDRQIAPRGLAFAADRDRGLQARIGAAGVLGAFAAQDLQQLALEFADIDVLNFDDFEALLRLIIRQRVDEVLDVGEALGCVHDHQVERVGIVPHRTPLGASRGFSFRSVEIQFHLLDHARHDFFLQMRDALLVGQQRIARNQAEGGNLQLIGNIAVGEALIAQQLLDLGQLVRRFADDQVAALNIHFALVAEGRVALRLDHGIDQRLDLRRDRRIDAVKASGQPWSDRLVQVLNQGGQFDQPRSGIGGDQLASALVQNHALAAQLRRAFSTPQQRLQNIFIV
ncbi:MAG: hypothetical protein BWZ10_02331 [candidate division BRC1 bacterium ADurb.BinA364]|nr:MAG: hypothetical protein BWZ10_02331 [candidate division BRC1 bacterium ADurb.BinA364]